MQTSSGAGGWNLSTYSGWTEAEGSRCCQHLLSKCDLFPSHHLTLKRILDHICLVTTFIIVFHFLIIGLGQRAPWVRKHMWESESVCSGLPYSVVKHSFLSVCSCPPLSCCFICLSKLFWHLGLNTQAESSLNGPISFKVTTHQLESEPGHRPRRGPGFLPLCVKWHEIRAQDYKHLKQLGLHSPLSRWEVSSFARSDLSCRHLQIQPDCWVFFFNLFSTVKNKKTPTIKYILKKKPQNPNPTKQQQNPQNQQKTPTKQVGESEW